MNVLAERFSACDETLRDVPYTRMNLFRCRTRDDADHWRAKRRWLVRSPNPLGDACMSLPTVRALRRSRADLHIAVACRENLTALWERSGVADEVISFDKGLGPLSVGHRLRERGSFDAGLLLPNSFRSALELRAAGIRDLLGYARHQRSFLLGLSVKERPKSPGLYRHHALYYLDLLTAAGIETPSLEEVMEIPSPPTPLTPGLKEIHLGVCPGAEYGNAKRYPIDRYAAAIQFVRQQHPEITFQISIFGSPAERGIGSDLASRLEEPCRNLVGETTITELVKELQGCHVLVSNDTGTMHLGAALGVPTVAIFGPTEPALTAPLGAIHRVIREPVECSPCFLRECPIDHRCMMRISPERVGGEILALINSYTGGER